MDRFYSTALNYMPLSLVLLALCIIPPTSLADTKATKSDLTFKIAPEKIQAEAKKGKFLPVKLFSKPVPMRVFVTSIKKTKKQNHELFLIGVIVDARNKGWPNDQITAHIRAVHKSTIKMLRGDRKKKVAGFAEKYGARVAKIVPIIFEPGQSIYKNKKGQKIEIPLEIDSILIAINDHPFPVQQNGKSIKSIKKFKFHVEKNLKDGNHLISKKAYLQKLINEIESLEAGVEVLKVDSIENILLQGLLDSATFSRSSAKGRAYRQKLESYFDKHGLKINKKRYDLHALIDKIGIHAIKIDRRGCELGDILGCTRLASSYKNGSGVKKDMIRAAQLFRKACKGGSKAACKQLKK